MKQLFSNLFSYALHSAIPGDFIKKANDRPFDGLSEERTSGYGFGQIIDGVRVIEADGRFLYRYCYHEKNADKTTLNTLTQQRVDQAVSEGREITDELAYQLKDQARKELLRYSPVKIISTFVLICPNENRIYVSAGNSNVAEDAIGLLRTTIVSLKVIPISFQKDPQIIFGFYIRNFKDPANTCYLPKPLDINGLSKLVCIGDDGERANIENIYIGNDGITELLSGLNVRSVEINLNDPKHNEDKLASFQLVSPHRGNIHLKKFDYGEKSILELDVQQANGDGNGDTLHQYAVEMLIVSRYVPLIFDALAKFCGGYSSNLEIENNEKK